MSAAGKIGKGSSSIKVTPPSYKVEARLVFVGILIAALGLVLSHQYPSFMTQNYQIAVYGTGGLPVLIALISAMRKCCLGGGKPPPKRAEPEVAHAASAPPAPLRKPADPLPPPSTPPPPPPPPAPVTAPAPATLPETPGRLLQRAASLAVTNAAASVAENTRSVVATVTSPAAILKGVTTVVGAVTSLGAAPAAAAEPSSSKSITDALSDGTIRSTADLDDAAANAESQHKKDIRSQKEEISKKVASGQMTPRDAVAAYVAIDMLAATIPTSAPATNSEPAPAPAAKPEPATPPPQVKPAQSMLDLIGRSLWNLSTQYFTETGLTVQNRSESAARPVNVQAIARLKLETFEAAIKADDVDSFKQLFNNMRLEEKRQEAEDLDLITEACRQIAPKIVGELFNMGVPYNVTEKATTARYLYVALAMGFGCGKHEDPAFMELITILARHETKERAMEILAEFKSKHGNGKGQSESSACAAVCRQVEQLTFKSEAVQ